MQEQTKVKFEELSKKLGIGMDVITAQFNAALKQSKELYAGKSEQWYEDRARHLVFSMYTESLKSKSVSLEYIAFYVGEAIDYNMNARELALLEFKTNPNQAIQKGLVNQQGEPLDTKEWFIEPSAGNKGSKNPNFGKPLQPFWQRRMVALATKFGESKLRLLVGTFRDDKAKLEIKKMTPLASRFNVKSEDQYTIAVTSGKKTELDPSTNPVFNGWNEDKIMDMLSGAPFKQTQETAEEWFEQHKSDKAAVILLEVDLISKSDEPTANGTYRVVFGSVEDADGVTLTSFLDEATYDLLKNMRTGTKVLGIGSMSLGQDFNTGTKTALIFNPMTLFVTMPVSDQEIDIKSVGA